MRYSDDLIEEVRTRNDIVNVIGEYVTLKKNGGSRYVGLCPFHNEKSPSFSVNRQTQLYYCFGCHVGGNLYTFMKEYESMTFTEALKYLADKAGIALPENPMTDEDRRRADESDRMKEIYRDAAVFFYKALFTPAGEIGLRYFNSRGLDREAIKKYGLGFAPSGGFLYRYLRKKGYTDRELENSKLVKVTERGVSDTFWNRVMFPIFDKAGHVIAFGGRVMDDSKPKYINSDETLIFKKSRNLYGQQLAAKSRGDVLLLCEGYMDVIALQQAGFNNAVAALGTAFNLDHVSAIKRTLRGKDKIVLTLDSDAAGINAARKVIQVLREGGMEDVRVLNMSPCKDPDEFIGRFGAEEYQKRIDAAKNSFLFEVECRRLEYDINNPDEKTKYHHSIAELLVPIKDEIMRNNYMEAACKQENIEYSVMKKLVNSMGETRRKQLAAAPEETKAYVKKKDPIDGIQRTEQMLLTWICSRPELIAPVASVLTPDDFSEEIGRKLAAYVFEAAKSGQVNPSGIVDGISDDEAVQAKIAAYFNYAGSEIADGVDQNRVLTESVVKIKRDSIQRRSKSITDILELQKIMVENKNLERISLSVPNNGH